MNASDVALIYGSLALVAFGVTALLGVETYLMWVQRPPITTYTRAAIVKWPGVTLTVVGVFIFCIGLLASHFVWDAMCVYP